MSHFSSLPPKDDLQSKWRLLQKKMISMGVEACLISSNVHLYYLCGEIFSGYLYLAIEGEPIACTKRDTAFRTDITTASIRKPEDIPAVLEKMGIRKPGSCMLEGDYLSYNEYDRLSRLFDATFYPSASAVLRQMRMIKTNWEIEQLRYSAQKHTQVYQQIPQCFKPGMSDVDFQICLEGLLRKEGSIGIFRGFGSNMEIHMGSLLVGDNAEVVSPFDFALGGKGIHPAAPIGANGTVLSEGKAIMVDMAGNYTAYISDMTRTFAEGQLPEIAYRAHDLSIRIQNKVEEIAKPGTACADLYQLALDMATEAGLGNYFMGTHFQAKFVGHGLGIEINEPPVLTGRSQEVLEENMCFALEPKFVLPQIGAVGVENTFLVCKQGIEKLTLAEEAIISLT